MGLEEVRPIDMVLIPNKNAATAATATRAVPRLNLDTITSGASTEEKKPNHFYSALCFAWEKFAGFCKAIFCWAIGLFSRKKTEPDASEIAGSPRAPSLEPHVDSDDSVVL